MLCGTSSYSFRVRRLEERILPGQERVVFADVPQGRAEGRSMLVQSDSVKGILDPC